MLAPSVCERSIREQFLRSHKMLAEQADRALRRAIVEKPLEILRRVFGNLRASGEEVVLCRCLLGADADCACGGAARADLAQCQAGRCRQHGSLTEGNINRPGGFPRGLHCV